MPDFNTGDFTQQGVNGHVNATVRLNEKRLVNIDMTSNENAEGCTITGTVKDLLNNKVYNIGSAPSGNIAITANTAEGETLNISQYATATVNVSGGSGINLRAVNIKFVNYSGADLTLSDIIYAKTVSGDRYSLATLPTITDDTVSTMIAFTLTEEEDYFVQFTPNTAVTTTVSENVNCTGSVDPDFGNVSIYVTDPTLGASITVRFDAAQR